MAARSHEKQHDCEQAADHEERDKGKLALVAKAFQQIGGNPPGGSELSGCEKGCYGKDSHFASWIGELVSPV
jgi:hypothetical protein